MTRLGAMGGRGPEYPKSVLVERNVVSMSSCVRPLMRKTNVNCILSKEHLYISARLLTINALRVSVRGWKADGIVPIRNCAGGGWTLCGFARVWVCGGDGVRRAIVTRFLKT